MIKIYKTKIYKLKCSSNDYTYLMSCFKLSAEVWNACVLADKECRENNNGKWLSKSKLQSVTKGINSLLAKSIQHTVHKYLYARSAILQARKSGANKEKYPYKIKKYFVVGWDSQSIKVNDNYIILPKRKLEGRIQNPVKCYMKRIPEHIVEVELIYKDKPYIAIKYKEEHEYQKIYSSNHASIDLGEIHSITSIDTNGNALIITGRKLREIKHLRNKQQSKIYNRLSKCERGSKQYYKYRKALTRLRYKTENKIRDIIHKTTKLYLDYCIKNQISVVYYGDLDSATRGTKQKRKGSRFIRQKLSQWNRGQLMRQLENKLNRYRITLIEVNESYTSQTCPCCGHRYHPKGRDYLCSECGYKQHRDIVGAINILNFNEKIKVAEYNTKQYLQIA